MMARPSTTAGTIPAAKSAPIDIPATTPMMMRSMAGGTRVDTPPAAAKMAVANSAGYFFCRIAGNAIEPIAAVFALGEPEIPEKVITDRDDDQAQTTGQASYKEHRHVDDPARHATLRYQGAGQHEKRHREQGKGVQTSQELLWQDDEKFG